MKPLAAVALGLCVLITSASAGAGRTCKATAMKQKLAGEALVNFVKQCETDKLRNKSENSRLPKARSFTPAAGSGRTFWGQPHGGAVTKLPPESIWGLPRHAAQRQGI